MAKQVFLPSLFRGLYKTESVPVSWDEVFRIITEDDLVRQQTEMYRRVGFEEAKRNLPCITPAVQMNGTGKTVKDIAGLTGFTMCDLDHVPEERVEEVRRLICADPHTFMCNVTVSGQGFHIIARWSSKDFRDSKVISAYADAFLLVNSYYADLVGHDYDDQCMNQNRTFSLSHDPEAFINKDAECFLLSTNFTNFTNYGASELGSGLRDDNKPQGDVACDGENSCNSRNSLTEKWVKVEKDRIVAAVEYVEKSGVRYVEHSRHTFLVNCVFHMNKLGVPRQDVERWMAQYDRPEREKRSIVRSIYENHADEFGSYDVPYEWVRELRDSKDFKDFRVSKTNSRTSDNLTGVFHTRTREAVHSFPDYQWPRFIQQMLDCADSKPQRDAMLLAIFAVLGAMIGRLVKVKYSKRFWSPALQVFIVAPPASGKSVIGWVRHLAEPLHDKQMTAYEAAKKLYDKDKAAYDNAGKERANMECPVAPAMKMFLIAGNNSSTGILENLADADGHALICESEADTLSAAINADYGNWDDTLRKAHDHDRLAYNRRTNKEYRQIQHPCLGVLICGTPAQVKPLIPSAENGLFSRQIFGSLPAISNFVNQFDEDEENEDMDTLFYNWGKEWLAQLDRLKTEVSCIRLRLTKEQQTEFNTQFSLLFHHADATQPSHHMMASVAREAINMLRIMEVVALVRAMDDCTLLNPAKDIPAENLKDGIAPRYDLFITDDDFHAVIGLAESIYRTACDMLLLLPAAEAVRNPQSGEEALLANLPLQFSRKEAIEAGEKQNLKEDAVDKILSRLFKDGKLLKPSRGNYEFVFPNEVQSSRVRV